MELDDPGFHHSVREIPGGVGGRRLESLQLGHLPVVVHAARIGLRGRLLAVSRNYLRRASTRASSSVLQVVHAGEVPSRTHAHVRISGAAEVFRPSSECRRRSHPCTKHGRGRVVTARRRGVARRGTILFRAKDVHDNALSDPFVVGIDHARDLVVAHHPRGPKVAYAHDSGSRLRRRRSHLNSAFLLFRERDLRCSRDGRRRGANWPHPSCGGVPGEVERAYVSSRTSRTAGILLPSIPGPTSSGRDLYTHKTAADPL